MNLSPAPCSYELARLCSVSAVAALLLATTIVPNDSSAQSAARQIGLGEARSFRSAILNEDRELQIALPETYGRTTILYPVLFLLDGSSHLFHASATARFLASARNRVPEMIVVAIPNAAAHSLQRTRGTICGLALPILRG